MVESRMPNGRKSFKFLSCGTFNRGITRARIIPDVRSSDQEGRLLKRFK